MVFIGYAAGAKVWRFYDPESRRVHVSRDAVFQEHSSWEWSKADDDDLQRRSDFVIDYVHDAEIDDLPLPITPGKGKS